MIFVLYFVEFNPGCSSWEASEQTRSQQEQAVHCRLLMQREVH